MLTPIPHSYFNTWKGSATLAFSLALGLLSPSSKSAVSFSAVNTLWKGSAAWFASGIVTPDLNRLIDSPIEVPLSGNINSEVEANLRSLRLRVASVDKVRIIVWVRAPFAPEGYQDSKTRQLQRQEIGVVQSIIELAS